MNGYLLGVIGTVLVCSLFTAIAPEGKTSTVVKAVARLACILTIIAPVLSFFKSGSLSAFTDKNRQDFFSENGIEQEGEFIQYYSEMRVREAEIALEEELADKYELSAKVALTWSLETEELNRLYSTQKIRIESMEITLLEETTKEVKEGMWLYLTKNYCSEVLIE